MRCAVPGPRRRSAAAEADTALLRAGLAVADRLCPRARLPKEGTFTHETEFKVPWMSTTGGGWKRKPATEELTTMKYRAEDLGPWLDVDRENECFKDHDEANKLAHGFYREPFIVPDLSV